MATQSLRSTTRGKHLWYQIWYQNSEIFFGHQMGPEQTLRRVKLGQIGAKLRYASLSFSTNQNLTPKYNGCVISGKKRKMFCDTEPQYGLAS